MSTIDPESARGMCDASIASSMCPLKYDQPSSGGRSNVYQTLSGCGECQAGGGRSRRARRGMAESGTLKRRGYRRVHSSSSVRSRMSSSVRVANNR